MKADLLTKLRCPARDCHKGGLILEAASTETINYESETVQEIKEGTVTCPSCNRTYPITDYVLNFNSLFPPELAEEASYWDMWYGFLWDRGDRGFLDLRRPRAHLIPEGVEIPDPSTTHNVDLPGTHTLLADSLLAQNAEWVLDIGCGTGWSSLYLARRKHKVVAFDPSFGNMRLAKRYAIEQGVYLEYIGAAVGYLMFEPNTFDAAMGLHSLHHVPDLKSEMPIISDWLRPNALIAIDEHIGSDPILAAIYVKLMEWARTEVFPKHRTLQPEDLTALPQAGSSRMEDAGSEEVIQSLVDNFEIESSTMRHVSLDLFSFFYYLWRDQDLEGYSHASKIVEIFYKLFAGAYPQSMEYLTLIGRKTDKRNPEQLEILTRQIAPDYNAMATTVAAAQEIINLNTAHITNLTNELNITKREIEHKNRAIADLEKWAAGLQSQVQEKNSIIARGNRSLPSAISSVVRRITRKPRR